MTNEEWNKQLSSYGLEEKTLMAINQIKPWTNNKIDLIRMAAEFAIADLIEYGFEDWSEWDADEVVETVRKVAGEFTQEIVDDTEVLMEMDLMLDDANLDTSESIDMLQALKGMRHGLLDLMLVAEHYLIMHEEVVKSCNSTN
tara:strand:- start:15652 stop:16080 length:429 start_codon:yes stop_codon:yes gene_type:complete